MIGAIRPSTIRQLSFKDRGGNNTSDAISRSFLCSPSQDYDARYSSLGAFLKSTRIVLSNTKLLNTFSAEDKTLHLSSIDKIPLCCATSSLGCRSKHLLVDKLNAISAAGLRCIELVMSDIVSFASQYLDTEVGPKDWHALCLAAAEIKEICAEKGIKITMIQALENFEGWLETSQEREDAYERANGWIGIMRAADTDLLLVAASDAPISKIGADHSRSIKDLRNLADMLSEYDFRLAYMNRCWSTHASRWSTAWDIVQQVRRSNIGLCLNTFHISGSQFGDPTTASGLIEKYTREQLGQRFKASLDRLSKTVPKDRIYMLQVGNAYKPKEPFPQVLGYQACPPKQRWYRDFRSLPFSGGYLPIVDVVKAVLKTGFRDWISYEVSDGGSNGHFKYYDLHAFAEAIVNRHYLMANSLCAENYTVQSLVT